MALSNLDRELLRDCLEGNDEAWRGFCDRFIGLFIHVVQHSAASQRLQLDEATRDDLVADVFVAILDNDFAALRRFRGDSSLASYLCVVARRTVIKRIAQWRQRGSDAFVEELRTDPPSREPSPHAQQTELRIDWQSPAVLRALTEEEVAAIRMFHLEGKSYREIGSTLGLAENSIGPFLSRAREKLKRTV